jgi:outer membrane protein assembly factor BamB
VVISVVAGGQVWMTTALEDGKSLRALCVDLESGKLCTMLRCFARLRCRRSSPEFPRSPTPVLDGDRLTSTSARSARPVFRRKTEQAWENTDLKIDHQNGPGGSPVLYKDRLLIPCDGMDFQYEVALDTKTGKVLWKTERSAVEKLRNKPDDLRKAYGTPVLLEIDGQMQSLTMAAERLYALDPNTGKELWYVDHPGFSNVPLPVSDEEAIYICTGFMKPELWAIKRGGGAKGDVTESHVLWKQKAGVPDQSSPVLVGDRIYMVTSGGIASCIDTKDGRIVGRSGSGATSRHPL